MNTAMVLKQAPTNAGVDANQPPSGQSTSVRQEPLGFKKKLEKCITTDECPYGMPTSMNQIGDNNQDNSMAAASPTQQVSSGIVGTLEGFGLLDYRSDLPQILSEIGQATQTDGTAADTAADTLFQGMTQNTEQTGTLEQYARMLSKDQLSRLPEDMQQAIIKAVGDYLGSFESTNNKQIQNTVAQDATQAVMPDMAENTAASTAADTATLPDEIASLLLKLKAVTQNTKPAESDFSTVSADTPMASADTEVQSVKTEPVAASVLTKQTDRPAVQTNQETMQTDKSKMPATDELPQQAPKTDAPMHTHTQLHVTQNTDTAEIKADVPQTTQTDFVKDNVMRIVDKLSTQVSDGKYDFDVELKPDFLGKVNIKLTMENGELRMHIKTDDIGVKGMFADQASAMQAVLKDKGISVTNIDITYQSQMQTGDDRQAHNQNSSKKQNSRTHASIEKLGGTEMFEKMTEITGYTHTGSSVEYLA